MREEPAAWGRIPALGVGTGTRVNLYCASRASGFDRLLNRDAHKTLKADWHHRTRPQPEWLQLTCWKMGAGIRGGTTHGATDEFGRRAIEDIATVWDYDATALHLLGFDREKLTHYHNGLDRRLTDVQGRVLRSILARFRSR